MGLDDLLVSGTSATESNPAEPSLFEINGDFSFAEGVTVRTTITEGAACPALSAGNNLLKRDEDDMSVLPIVMPIVVPPADDNADPPILALMAYEKTLCIHLYADEMKAMTVPATYPYTVDVDLDGKEDTLGPEDAMLTLGRIMRDGTHCPYPLPHHMGGIQPADNVV